jgi:regulator of ribosome biosynthesis
VAKNEQQRLKNLQRAAANAATQTKSAATNNSEREARKKMIERELKVTKMSTASMGKFDKKLEGEKKEKNVKRKVRPRFRSTFAFIHADHSYSL